jgi:hypothetical protein
MTMRPGTSMKAGPSARLRAGAEPRGRPRLPGWTGLAVTSALAVAGLLGFLLPLGWVKIGSMNGLGLISVLPVASLAGLGLLIAAFAAMLVRRKPVALVLLAMLVAIIFCLDGVTSIVEPLPRFATTYQLYGFVNYVRHTGAVAPGVAAYFSWPGFFALIGFAAKAAGAHSLLPLLKWWPVIIDTLIVVPFMLLTRALKITWRARWLAALLLCVGNWVGQDYFSPQSLNFLLYLAFIAILLTWFIGQVTSKPGSRQALRAGRRPRVPGERSASQVSTTQRALLLVLVIGIFAASVISHQLTPFLMIASCAGLVIVGRCTPRGLPVLLGVIAIGWISFATVGYWSGHLSTIFGQIGRLSGTINSSVGARLIGTPMHEYPVYGRLVLAGLIVGMALLGLLRRWHRRMTDRALLILLLAPLSIAALQNYGGEIALRIYLFALPAAAVLAACLFFPQADTKPDTGTATAHDSGTAIAPEPADRRTWPATRLVPAVASGLVAVTLAGLFMLTRYGNEAYEQIPRGEKAAMDYIYARAGGGTSVLWLSRPAGINATPQMPWQYRDIANVQFVSRDSPRNPAEVAGVIAELKQLGRGAFLIVTTTEATFIRQTASFAPHWVRSFRAAMSGAPGVRLVLNNRDAAVYQARLPASAPRARSNLHAARSVSGSTIWTPVGLAALALAVLLLAARELIRAALPGRRSLMRPLALAACPAVLLLLIAVIERFKVIS